MNPLVQLLLMSALVGGVVGVAATLLGFNIFERLAARRARRALEKDEFWSREYFPPDGD